MRTKLIVNPTAGRKLGVPVNRYTPVDVVAALGARRIAVDAVETRRPGHARLLAGQAVADGYQLILVAGGDGTVHEVAQALVGRPVVLGLLPLGSIMNLARMLNIPRDLAAAIEVLREGNVVPIDVGRVGCEYFLEAAGAGVEARIFHLTGEIDRGRWHRLIDLIRVIRGYRPCWLDLTADERPLHVRAVSVTATNGPLYAAAQSFAPEAKLDDGRLDVAIFGPMSRLDMLRRWLAPGALGQPPPELLHLQARCLTIRPGRRWAIHADALPVGFTPAAFEIVPVALRVIVGPVAPGERSALSRPPCLARPMPGHLVAAPHPRGRP